MISRVSASPGNSHLAAAGKWSFADIRGTDEAHDPDSVHVNRSKGRHIPPEKILDAPKRAEIFRYIKEHPGSSPTDIQKELHFAWSSVIHHVETLQGAGMITSEHFGKNRFLWPKGEKHEGRLPSALAHEAVGKVFEQIRLHGPISQEALALSLHISPSNASYHVNRLIGRGLVEKHRVGKTLLIQRTPHDSQH